MKTDELTIIEESFDKFVQYCEHRADLDEKDEVAYMAKDIKHMLDVVDTKLDLYKTMSENYISHSCIK